MDLRVAADVSVLPSSDELVVLTKEGKVLVYGIDDALVELDHEVTENVDFIACRQDSQIAINKTTGHVWFREEQSARYTLKRVDNILATALDWWGEELLVLYKNECKVLNPETGESIRSIKLEKEILSQRVSVAAGKDRGIVVMDHEVGLVSIYNERTELEVSFGGVGTGDLEFNNSSKMITDSKGNLIVADTGNNRVHVFSPQGVLVWSFHDDGSGNILLNPRFVSTDLNDNIFIEHSSGKLVFLAWETETTSDASSSAGDLADEMKQSEEVRTVQARVVRTRNFTGNNPFVKVNLYEGGKCDPNSWQTTETLSGDPFVWDQTFTVANVPTTSSTLRFELWQHDPICDAFRGGVCVENIKESCGSLPTWHTIRDATGQVIGELEVGLEFVEDEDEEDKYASDFEEKEQTYLEQKHELLDSFRRKKDSVTDSAASSMEEEKQDQGDEASEEREEKEQHIEKKQVMPLPDESPLELIRQLVQALKSHSAYRRIESLARLATTNQSLQRQISLELGVDGFRVLAMNLESRKNLRARGASIELLHALVPSCAKSQSLLVQGLDWPGLLVDNLFFFHIPERFRQQFATTVVAEDELSEEGFIAYLSKLFSQKEKLSEQGGLWTCEDDFGTSHALAIRVVSASVIERIRKKSSEMSWYQGIRLIKLYHRFHELLRKGEKSARAVLLIQDPLISLYVNLSGLTGHPTLTWQNVRNYYWFQTYQIRQSGTITNYRQDVQIYSKTCGIQGRTVKICGINERADGVLSQIRFEVVDCKTEVNFKCTTKLETVHDALLASTETIEKAAHRLRFPSTFVDGSNNSSEEDNVLMLEMEKIVDLDKKPIQSKLVRPAQEDRDHVREMLDAMPKVASLWNTGETEKRMEACVLLLDLSQPVVPLIPLHLRERRVRLIEAIKRAKVEFSEENTIRLWKACEKYLRAPKHKPQDPTPHRRRPASKKRRNVYRTLFEKTKASLERSDEEQRSYAYQVSLIQQKAFEKRRKEKLAAQHALRHERAAEAMEAEKRLKVRKEKEAQLHAQWYREESKLYQLQLAMVQEKRKKEQAQRNQARLKNDRAREETIERNRRLREENLKKYLAKHKRVEAKRAQAGFVVDDVASQDSIVSVPDRLHFSPIPDFDNTDDGTTKKTCDEPNLFSQVKWEEVVDVPELPSKAPTHSRKLAKEIRRARKYEVPIDESYI